MTEETFIRILNARLAHFFEQMVAHFDERIEKSSLANKTQVERLQQTMDDLIKRRQNYEQR